MSTNFAFEFMSPPKYEGMSLISTFFFPTRLDLSKHLLKVIKMLISTSGVLSPNPSQIRQLLTFNTSLNG